MKSAGYATFFAGKWHLGPDGWWPEQQGFDLNLGGTERGGPYGGNRYFSPYGNPRLTDGPPGEHLPDRLATETAKFIEANKDRPFFLYFAHKDVHLPFFPSSRFKGRSAAGPFGDAAEELDWSVGEILRALDAHARLRDDTVVIFTSDNGPWYAGSAGGLRGRKGMPFEGGQRVPMIVSWPARLPTAIQADAPSMNIDVFPTLLAITGLDLPTDRIGRVRPRTLPSRNCPRGNSRRYTWQRSKASSRASTSSRKC